jgi:hypothetical protein
MYKLKFSMGIVPISYYDFTYPSRNDAGTSAIISSNGFPIPKMVPSLKQHINLNQKQNS